MSNELEQIKNILANFAVHVNKCHKDGSEPNLNPWADLFESLLSKQRDLSELVEWKVSKTKEILLDFNGSDSNRLKAVAIVIHSEKILEDQAINQVLSIIKDTNEVAEEEEENK